MIIAGFGYRNAASAKSLLSALEATGEKPDLLVGLQGKDPTPLQELGQFLGCSTRLISQEAAQRHPTPTQSAASLSAYGVGSVAEACALAAAGIGGRLIISRQISEDGQATCAIAEGRAE